MHVDRHIERLVRGAGKIIQDMQGAAKQKSKGIGGNIVTDADIASESYLTTQIHNLFPDHAILSEESFASADFAAPHLWVIDPIDGTNNYAFGRPFYSVSVAYAENGSVKAAGVYSPAIDELYIAIRGKGAYRNGTRFTLPARPAGHHWIVAGDISYDGTVTRRHLDILRRLDPPPFVVMFGSAAMELCWAASGRIDVYLHSDLKPWDVAAASLVITEAGGSINNFSGSSAPWWSPEIVAGSRRYVSQVLNHISA